MMSLSNEFNDFGSITKKDLEIFLILLHPVAPHITEEIWQEIGLEGYLHDKTWPKYDESKTKDQVIQMPIQVNGKVRGTIEIGIDDTQDKIKEIALLDENIKKFVNEKTIIKEIFVPGKIYNIVVK